MNELIVDTSVWIEFFAGRTLPDVEMALQEGRVLLSPVVLAELLSGSRKESDRKKVVDFLEELDLHPTPRSHWAAVGCLRRSLLDKGLKVSIPDAHVAQCALEVQGTLYSFDDVFRRIGRKIPLKLL